MKGDLTKGPCRACTTGNGTCSCGRRWVEVDRCTCGPRGSDGPAEDCPEHGDSLPKKPSFSITDTPLVPPITFRSEQWFLDMEFEIDTMEDSVFEEIYERLHMVKAPGYHEVEDAIRSSHRLQKHVMERHTRLLRNRAEQALGRPLS